MNETYIGKDCELYKAIIAENVTVNDNVKLGMGDEVPNETDPHIYNSGMVTIGEKSIIPCFSQSRCPQICIGAAVSYCWYKFSNILRKG